MFLHVRLPGFHALVHQAQTPSLRRRPVVVATDRGDQAPIMSSSPEATAAGIDRRLRVAAARQLCPDLVVRLLSVDGARLLQADVAAAALEATPLVASAPGHWIVDLRGTQSFWNTRLVPGRVITDVGDQALLLANQIRSRIHEDVGFAPVIGIAERPLTAHLATRIARSLPPPRPGVHLIRPAEEQQIIDALPVHWLPIGSTLLDHLVFMHHLTIGDVRSLGRTGLRTLAGAAGEALAAQLIGDDHLLPAALDAEPSCTAQTTTGPDGGDPRSLLSLLASLAQQVGDRLRRHHLAATKLSLTVRWGPGTTRHSSLPTGYQVRDDRELVHLAEHLLIRTDASAEGACTWLRLSASGLCAAEDQQALFRLSGPLSTKVPTQDSTPLALKSVSTP